MTRGCLLLSALLTTSLLLRVVPWVTNLPLHHDEALYGTWARAIADGSDPLLLIPWVDKPPLVLYLLALSLNLFGSSEIALRAPGMLASMLTVFATYGLARRLYGERTALLAGALIALSPFAILFGPTAFTDPWLTLFMIAASWAAIAGRPLWAGILLGLALASKQQGVFGVPLVLALLVARNAVSTPGSTRRAGVLKDTGLALLGFLPVFSVVTCWDSLRWHNRPSYWDQSLRTYGGVVLAPLAEWSQRGAEWAQQVGYLFGAPALTALLLSFVVVSLVVQTSRRTESQPRLIGELLASYILGYLVVHLVFTFQPWDRYLLPVLPLLCVLGGRGLLLFWSTVRTALPLRTARWAAAPLGVALVYAASFGVTAAIPVGSDIGAYHGVAETAHFLARQPAGTTVYFDRLGWHLDYYLYSLPITRSWYDGPAKLAREAARVAKEEPGRAQWLLLPDWELDSLAALEDALAGQGLTTLPRTTTLTARGAIGPTLYRIEQPRTIASTERSPAESTP